MMLGLCECVCVNHCDLDRELSPLNVVSSHSRRKLAAANHAAKHGDQVFSRGQWVYV